MLCRLRNGCINSTDNVNVCNEEVFVPVQSSSWHKAAPVTEQSWRHCVQAKKTRPEFVTEHIILQLLRHIHLLNCVPYSTMIKRKQTFCFFKITQTSILSFFKYRVPRLVQATTFCNAILKSHKNIRIFSENTIHHLKECVVHTFGSTSIDLMKQCWARAKFSRPDVRERKWHKKNCITSKVVSLFSY